MPNLKDYIYPDFINTGMGLMCDFTDKINKVYTTVFLSDKVLSEVLYDNIENALIFTHHPTNWDIKNHFGNYAPTEEYIKKLKERNISVYVLHHPLDNFGEYSTCKTLASALKINIESKAFLYCGAYCGVVGYSSCDNIHELSRLYSDVVGHKTSLYKYGMENIQNEKIAICPGGGNDLFVVNEMLEKNIKILITGVSIHNEHSDKVHILEKEKRINVLGGTHYSSEKFACIKMCEYFKEVGLHSEFVEDVADLYDL